MAIDNERQQLKAMLQGAGLKVSLVRLKILEVLQRSDKGLRSRELHGFLLLADEQISVLSVRQVLSRLCACGLVERDEQGLYRLLLVRPQTGSVALAG
jgi:Fe2+ or Zn2+ uptake regulation protein